MKIRPQQLLTAYLILIMSITAQSIPSLVNYQGRVSDASGDPLSGNMNIAVKIHSHETNEAETYSEDLGSVAVNNGLFAIQFGSGTNFPSALAQAEAWLEVSVDGTPLLPRQRLVAVPYAMNAAALGSVRAEDPAAPVAGMIRWTGSAFEGFTGTAWEALGAAAGQPLLSVEMVEVGNPNNADDTASNNLGGNSGAVGYTYSIGKYEVSNAEYTIFLNAVDPNGVNAVDLYDLRMGGDVRAGITFTATNPDGSKYAVKPNFGDKPVIYVSFYDAMRFCNWLHNGAEEGSDTENGAYTLLPAVDPLTGSPTNGVTVIRNAGAKFALPTEDEWYKAAYYQPQALGGDSDNYWLYPTGGNVVPNAGTPPGTAPAANYNAAGSVNDLTNVGAYSTTVGFYGTFDMAGNVSEWTETRDGSRRVIRGGSWNTGEFNLQSGFPNITPAEEEDFDIGFRVSRP